MRGMNRIGISALIAALLAVGCTTGTATAVQFVGKDGGR